MKKNYCKPSMVIYEMKSGGILAGSFQEGETGGEVTGGGIVGGGEAL